MINIFIKSFIIIFSLNIMGCSDPEESEIIDLDVEGCMDQSACNHDVNATADDGSCIYAEQNHDCDGGCALELDCVGTCGGSSVNCPEWLDDPGAYIFSATFAGLVIINNEQGEGDVLAAFDSEGDVRGVAVQLIPPFGPHKGEIVYEMQIRSNVEGDLLTFKYYDASKDIVFDIVENHEFTTNEVMGDVINPVEFNVIPILSDLLIIIHPFRI